MASFIVRNIDPEFWARVKSKAALERVSVNAVIQVLLAEWVQQPNKRAEKSARWNQPKEPKP
jgi:hypothetical protein